MTLGPDDERPQPSEPTFADVMNGFSLDGGRSPRRRRWGRRGRDEDEDDASVSEQPEQAPLTSPPVPPSLATEQIDPPAVPVDELDRGTDASSVRPYTWTRGRTRSGLDLAIETLVSTSRRGRDQLGLLPVEHRAVAELCTQPRSVAEVAALMSIPLGVARVLLGDMAGLGVVTVHQTASSAGNAPDLALMERVLSGLRRL